jgi:hypothetical protein
LIFRREDDLSAADEHRFTPIKMCCNAGVDINPDNLYNVKYFRLRSRMLAVEVSMSVSPWKQPSAWLPIAMSSAALALVLAHVAIYGAVREADEGTPAHIWQLLMAGQVPVVAYFALKWLPQAPGRGLRVLAVQAIAGLAACAPVFWFQL